MKSLARWDTFLVTVLEFSFSFNAYLQVYSQPPR
jgi:hypothetical protein